MPAGTIALTNGSTTVTGTGTSFTTELKAGDFVYVMVGGAPYTMVVSVVTSNTQLALAVAFDGPSTSGLSWVAAPALMLSAITQKMLNDFANVARGRILDFQNWQKIYSSAQSVTVTRPDRTTFTGPSWGYMADQFATKANKGANSDITSLTGLTTPLSTAYGGTGAINAAGAWANLARYGNAAGTAAQGNDSRLAKVWATINGGTGSIAASNGVTSVTKSGTGDWTIFFTGFSDNTYSFSVTGFTTGNAITTYGFATKSPGSLRIRCVSGSDLVDPSQFMIQIFGNS